MWIHVLPATQVPLLVAMASVVAQLVSIRASRKHKVEGELVVKHYILPGVIGVVPGVVTVEYGVSTGNSDVNWFYPFDLRHVTVNWFNSTGSYTQ